MILLPKAGAFVYNFQGSERGKEEEKERFFPGAPGLRMT